MPLPVSRFAILTVSLLLSVGSAVAQAGQQPPAASVLQVRVGWNGAYFVGRWVRVVAETEVTTDQAYRLHVTAPDPDGHRVTFPAAVAEQLAPGRHLLNGYCKLGQFDFSKGRTRLVSPEISVRVLAEGSALPISSSSGSGLVASSLPMPLEPGTRLVVTVGQPRGFENSPKGNDKSTNGTRVENVSTEELPAEALAYDGVSLLVLAGELTLSSTQSEAMRQWVSRGGRVLVTLPAAQASASRMLEPFSSWLPVTLTGVPNVVREFSSLEAYASRNLRVPFTGRLSVPKVRVEQGVVLSGGRDDALLVRAPYGLGSVTVLTLDLTQPPLSQWEGVGTLCQRMLSDVTSSEDLGDAKASKQAQLSSTGVTDLATQLHAIEDSFDGVTRVSPWFVMGLLGLLLITIGPLDYLLVHRLLRRPRATWITFPLWIVLAAGLAAQGATFWNGTTLKVNQFHLLNFDVATGTFRSRLLTNLSSPVTRTLNSVTDSPVVPVSTASEAAARQSQCCWSGIPEATFGGMYRSSGLNVGRGDYRRTSNNVLQDLPLVQWSSKSLQSEAAGPATNLAESELTSSGTGRLTGTLTHRLNGELTDWCLVYGNRVYRHCKVREDIATLPLPSGRLWRVEQPNVFQRELRPFLTGQVTVATRKDGSKTQEISHRQAVYDPLSLDAFHLARMLTFHEEAGGTKYTGLTNRLLDDEDLSHLIRLGRAVLFGRLEGPASALTISSTTGGDSADRASLMSVTPTRETTFVRLVFPVSRVGEAPRELESFDPNKNK